MITKKIIENSPSDCGVYIFYKKNIPIYIGKAINIKARLLSHFRNAKFDKKEKLILTLSSKLSFKIFPTEFQALIEEARLISKFQPKYNVIWKDNKSYLYIKVSIKDKYPKILLTRKEKNKNNIYFGPFSSSNTANKIIRLIRKIYPFCSDKKISKKPCFYSKINLCAPCPNYIENLSDKEVARKLQKKYKSQIKNITALLSGNVEKIKTKIEKEIKKLSQKKQFEKAILEREKLFILNQLLSNKITQDLDEINNNSKNTLSKIKQIIKENFDKKISKNIRIECYDISNLSGLNPTASMVVFKNNLPEKKSYRKFKIKRVKKISDFDMLQEVFERRFNNKDWTLPDLILVDGGKPQIIAVKKILNKLSIDKPLIGIAKNPDRLICENNNFAQINLTEKEDVLNLFRFIRDESHRFAKKFHIFLRNKDFQAKKLL